jgi:hypothetical protein
MASYLAFLTYAGSLEESEVIDAGLPSAVGE